MSSTHGGVGRLVGMVVALAAAIVLLLAGHARAGFYEVAQCGWGVGTDADWWDSTGGVKFRPDDGSPITRRASPAAGPGR